MLRAKNFSCGLDVLYGGPEISKLQFLIINRKEKISAEFPLNLRIRIRIRIPLKYWIRNRIQSTTLDVRGRYLLVKDEGGAGRDVKELEPGHSQALCLELQVLCGRQSWNTNFSPTIYGQE
jgi:hypothetical protein